MSLYRVAFGMEDEKKLTDGHYGDSKFFLIYEIEDGKIRFVERRENKAADIEEAEHGDVNKFKAVISQLGDVDILAAYRMGPNFVRIKNNTKKRVIFTKTRDLEEAIKRVIEEIEKSK